MTPKTIAASAIDAAAGELHDISRRLHAHPEIGFQEFESSRLVADRLEQAGFVLTRHAFDLPTAFVATRGTGSLQIGICAEYDSLPGIGHACGHNLIAATAIGAAVGLAAVADAIDATVHVLGTPAEEVGDGGGKILMLERGAFRDLHMAMMVHPAPFDVLTPRLVASCTFDVHYTGRASHAGGFPELGINAADALTVAQTSIGLLRQHLEPDDRVHGIVTHGGDAPNIVPAHTTARYTLRAGSLERLEELRRRVLRCFEAGALATGCTWHVDGGTRPYAEVRHDRELAAIYRRNAETLGRQFVDSGPVAERPTASTDMGNVSRLVASIHPLIGIDSSPAVNHQPEFAAAVITPAAERATLDGAIALAWTAIDAAEDPLRARLLAARAR
ncbi:MAG: M20 family metallopeptidase [Vicinamibacterales bacterium]